MGSQTLAPSGQPGPMQPGDYTPAGQSSVVTWSMKRLDPPSPLYVRVDDVLRVAAASSTINEVVTINGRLLRSLDGRVVPISFTVGPLNNRVLLSQDNALAEGFLLSLSCQAAVANRRGITFVRLFLNPKALGNTQPALMLMADYVTNTIASGFPNGRITSPTEGPGVIYPFQVANPAAGQEFIITIPPNALWKVHAVNAVLVTAAGGGNRIPVLRAWNNSVDVFRSCGAISQAPSTSLNYTWGPGQAFNFDTVQNCTMPLPSDCMLAIGYNMKSVTAQFQPADQWVNPVAWVEEWLENV